MDIRLRYEVLERDDYTCQLCGGPAQEIDHIVPRSHFGKKRKAECEAASNLRAICCACHRKRHG